MFSTQTRTIKWLKSSWPNIEVMVKIVSHLSCNAMTSLVRKKIFKCSIALTWSIYSTKPKCKLNSNLEAILSDQGSMKQMQIRKYRACNSPEINVTSANVWTVSVSVKAAAMAEWLRRWTWNPMGYSRAGSNPARRVLLKTPDALGLFDQFFWGFTICFE